MSKISHPHPPHEILKQNLFKKMKNNSNTTQERKLTMREGIEAMHQEDAARAGRIIYMTASYDDIAGHSSEIIAENVARWKTEASEKGKLGRHGLKGLALKRRRRLQVLIAEGEAILKQRARPDFVDIRALERELAQDSAQDGIEREGAEVESWRRYAPGPWDLVDKSEETTAIPAWDVVARDGEIVAYMDPDGDISMEMDRANAELVAAAPELFEALELAHPLMVAFTPKQEAIMDQVAELVARLQKGGAHE